MGRLSEKVKDRIKQLVKLGCKDHEIVEDVGVVRQTVAKYRLVVLEEIKVEAAARVEEERRRREKSKKEIRDHQIRLDRDRALKRQEEEQAEEERRQRVRIQQQIRERAEEQARLEKANRELQAYFVKAEVDDRASFMERYNLLYTINEEAEQKNTKAHFTKIVAPFGFPFDKFIYSEEERQGLPLMLMDRGTMEFALKSGLWPWRKTPLTELIDGLKALNEPQQDSASVDDATLLEIIKLDPFFFLRARADKNKLNI